LVLPALASLSLLIWIWGGSIFALLDQSRVLAQAVIDYTESPIPRTLSAASMRSFLESGIIIVPLPFVWLVVRAHAAGQQRYTKLLGSFAVLQLAAAGIIGGLAPTKLPLLTVSAVACVVWARTRLDLERNEWFVLELTTLQMHYLLSRPFSDHYMALMPVVALLLVVGLAHGARRERLQLLAASALLCAPVLVSNLIRIPRDTPSSVAQLGLLPKLMRTQDAALFGVCEPRCEPWRSDKAAVAAAAYIRAHTRPEEAVFSGLLRHSARPVVEGRNVMHHNDLRSYWLMRRPAGTRYSMMFPGMSTGKEREREIISDLQKRDVRWLLLWQGAHALPTNPEEQGLLDRYIREHYERAVRFDDYECWHRRNMARAAL
jgi:hypothetical protein